MIKKHKNKNRYFVTESGFYIRDFTVDGIKPVDINKIAVASDYDLFIDNESHNLQYRYPQIDNEIINHPNVIIVSDGFEFEKRQELLGELPKNVAIIAINGALKKWRLFGENSIKKAINYYVVNNPYPDCMQYMPVHRYMPRMIASYRTCPEFIDRYDGNKFMYCPTRDEEYSGLGCQGDYYIDDYRNVLCAALGLAYRFKAIKIMLFCCDDSFQDERPNAELLDNGLWRYPQQKLSQEIVDSYAFWLKSKKIDIVDCSNGANYNNIAYINFEQGSLLRYFTND